MIHEEHGSANSAPPPEIGQVARAAAPNETSQMQTPALNVPAQPPCRMMIVRRSKL